MSSQATLIRSKAEWSDDDEYSAPPPLERVTDVGSPTKQLAREALREGLAEELIDEVAELLETLYRFHPTVSFGADGRAYMWLPEFGLDADGDDFDEAADNLVEEVLEYVDDWERDLRTSPNHSVNGGWVRVVQLNRAPSRVYRLLFGE